MQLSGEQSGYIPCLNDDALHIRLFSELISRHTQGWDWACTVTGHPPGSIRNSAIL
jgi:hypothetical protein